MVEAARTPIGAPHAAGAIAALAAGAFIFWAGMAAAHPRLESGATSSPGRLSEVAVRLETAGAAVFPLQTEVVFDTGDGAPQRSVVEGTGTVLYGRYVLTVAHATTVCYLEAKVRTPHGEMILPVEGRRLSETTWLVAGDRRLTLVPVARDEMVDVALFSLPAGPDPPR